MILYDGRVIVVCTFFLSQLPRADSKGKLRGYDPRTNVILSDCVEREYSTDQGVEMIPLGLYMIKGDNVYALLYFSGNTRLINRAMVAEMDEEKDSTIDYTEIKAEPLGEIKF